MMADAQGIAEAVRKSDNLRLPRDPKGALKSLLRVAKLKRSERKDGAA